eukprot:CAMPEP_0176479956 /NCGR_PEP_ID=MMETSP0200_2-20121128/2022_1 /TAXON_ID=947934 /ORGANISM="Chaetoceros sp., Strain GSL56" /LENGTH=678 /DNA_ID=CAMNT_0017876047 /DNA_START=213 /DNA_END=2249 /DNA_ORIENTATION=+
MSPNASNEEGSMSLLSDPFHNTSNATLLSSSNDVAIGDLLGLLDETTTRNEYDNVTEQTNMNNLNDSIDSDILFFNHPHCDQQHQDQQKEQDNAILSLATELSQGQTAARSMQLDDAFQSLEKMRKANLEIEFGRAVDSRKCVQCLRKQLAQKTHKHSSTPSLYYKRLLQRPSLKKPKPCLMCGSPTCVQHADKAFKQSKVIICTECSPLFSLDFVIECVAHKHNTDDPEAARKQRHQIKHMIDVYDRVRLLLEYTAQFIDEIADTLEKLSKKEDRIGLGCNTSGVASGVAGVAAAACFVTPAGPPLLIASLLFSGASQLTSTGSKMVNYYSTPNKIAFKIISLYNVCKSVLTVTTVLRDALLKDHINLEKYVENMIKETEEAVLEMKTGFEEEESSAEEEDGDGDLEQDDDANFFDDASVSSMNSASPSVRSGNVTLYSNVTESQLGKIVESESHNVETNDHDGKSASQMLSYESLDSFASENNNVEDSATSGAVQSSEAVLAAQRSGLFSPWKKSSPSDDLAKEEQNDGKASMTERTVTDDETTILTVQTSSPSKKERIEKIKETNHFMEREDGIGKLARFYSRSSLAGSSLVSATVTMMAAGAALSLVHFAFEANNLAATIKRIQAGSPSKRAQALRIIKDDVRNLPATQLIAEEWEKYLEVLARRQEMVHEHVI